MEKTNIFNDIIVKLIIDNPNDMELGSKIRKLYWDYIKNIDKK